MARRNTSLADDLVSAPWWVSVVLGVISYGVFRYVFPSLGGNIHAAPGAGGFSSGIFRGVAQMGPFLANIAVLFFCATTVLSLASTAVKRHKGTGLFGKQTDMDTLRSLSWRNFERLVGEVYRRKGYTITETGGGGADGGVDLVLKKNGETIFVQCKHWKMERVGVVIVRELLGVVYDRNASGGIVITSGTFTQEAIDTARGNPIELVDGKELHAMIGRIKGAERPLKIVNPAPPKPPAPEIQALPQCPVCGREMVVRTAKKGPNAGMRFYGCPAFPRCKGVRSC